MSDSAQRPAKRPRKAEDFPRELPPQRPPQHDPQPHIDHIFIADGLLNKKPGGKKAPLSCCECRRLKLKCDRNFPCASCKKRGCAEICPDGVLVSGKGTRFILANTEQLHSKIQEMSDRIRNLEDAVRVTNPGSPLLATDLMSIKSTMGLYSSNGGQENDGRKTNNVPSDAEHHRTLNTGKAPAEDSAMRVDSSLCTAKGNTITFDLTAIQSDISHLSSSFPLSSSYQNTPERNVAMREHIRSQLPSRAEAQRLWDQARRNALWQYNPHPSVTFFPNLLHHIYSSSSDKSPKPIRDIDPRRLALLLMILAVACVVDVPSTSDSPTGSSNQSASSNPMHAAHLEAEARASRYHDLGRASLCEIPIMEETNVDTVLALFYEVWFLAVWSDGKKAVGEAWGIMGLVAKLAQSIGLHRGGGKSKVIPEEVEKRRALFWELLYLDARLSLSLGRPPSLSIHHMDCPRPSYAPDDEFELCESPHYFQEWKHTSYQQFLVPVLDAISKPGLDYKSVLELDRRIRDFAVPLPLRNKEKCASRNIALQRASMGTAVEAVLLQLHRSYFIRALSGPEEAFNRRHKYAPSVVAVFLSASRMIATIQELFQKEPELTSRILWYWSNAFSAAIALCLLVSRAPFTCLSPAALQDLQRARLLFRAGKEICPRASQVLPILETMVDKANDIYFRWSNGQELPTIVLRHITEDGTSYTAGDEHDNERRSPSVPPEDAFLYTHQSLAQCIAEVHQIARTMFPLRKPCNCSNRAAHQPNTNGTNSIGKQGVAVPPNSSRSSPSTTMMAQPDCPPSHEWSPPPIINGASPVLPEAPPVGYMGSGPAVGIGYPTYNRNGRMNGTSSYSSLSGSGMSPSPSPPVYGQQHMAGATFANGTPTYNGYNTNGASGGMYSPSTASSATVSYTKPNSPTYATPTALSPSTSQVPLQSHYSQQQQQQQQHLSSPVHSNNTGPGFYTSVAVLPASGPPVALPPPSSKLAMMDTINFELGALSANNEQSFMVFY